jgi:asparagine synthase (glutamine-hydrolysing)
MTSKDGEFVQWYKRDWTDYEAVKITKQTSKI